LVKVVVVVEVVFDNVEEEVLIKRINLRKTVKKKNLQVKFLKFILFNKIQFHR
jgi:hypothetical protein